MMYSEFLDGTGCKQNDHNFKVFKRIEAAYMSDETMTKEDAYEWGRMLVDNSPTAEEVAIIEDIERQIADHTLWIEEANKDVEYYKNQLAEARNSLALWKTQKRSLQARLKELK